QGALPELSPRFRQRLAHRHRRHRRSLPPHRGRPLRRHRSPLGTRRRRSDPQATSTPQQRRLPELLDVAPGPRTTTRPRIPLPRRRPTQGSMTSLQRSHTLFVLFALTTGAKSYCLAAGYVYLLAAGAVRLQGWWAAHRARSWLVAMATALTTALILPVVLPILPASDIAGLLAINAPLGEEVGWPG